MNVEAIMGSGPDKLRIAIKLLWLSNVFPVRFLNIILIDHGILKGSVNALVPKELLDLLNGHAFINCHCSQGPPELMGMNLMKAEVTANLPQANLNTTNLEPFKRLQERNKQGFILIRALSQISLKVDLRAGVEVHPALLVSLPKNYTFPVFKIHIIAVQLY